eukprot:1777479-Rhodomonas_salina.1
MGWVNGIALCVISHTRACVTASLTSTAQQRRACVCVGVGDLNRSKNRPNREDAAKRRVKQGSEDARKDAREERGGRRRDLGGRPGEDEQVLREGEHHRCNQPRVVPTARESAA